MAREYSVDYHALGDVGDTLTNLTGEFGGAEDGVDGYKGDVAHEEVMDALGDFASNWSDDRGEIVEKMENVAGFAKQAATAYGDVDTQLADGYTNA